MDVSLWAVLVKYLRINSGVAEMLSAFMVGVETEVPNGRRILDELRRSGLIRNGAKMSKESVLNLRQLNSE